MDANQLFSKIENGEISPYNIYNLDIDYPQYYAVKHYLNNDFDTIDNNQKLHKVYVDIEVYSENKMDIKNIESGQYPVSAITLYSNFENKLYSFFLLDKRNIEKWKSIDNHVEYFKKSLIKNNYIKKDVDIELKTYNSDMSLIKDTWNQIHELDPVILSGFNSDLFDYPYIYFRLKNLYNGDEKSISKILSKFGDVRLSKFGGKNIIKFNEYILADILYIFKPRDDGGLNFGKKMPSYTLDYVSEKLLKLKKFDYKNNGMSLDDFYIDDPIHYLLYNIIDVCLTQGIDDKMKLIDSYNMYRRLMKTPLDLSLRGSTPLFDTLVLEKLTSKNEYVRFGINKETILSLTKTDLDKIPKPLSKKSIKWNLQSIDERTYLKITSHYEGAYVKDSPGKIFDTNDGLIIDLDAQSLYPSMMRQNNISFDTYYGRILNPETTNKTIDLIDKLLKNRNEQTIKSLYSTFLDLIITHIDSGKINVTNMNDSVQQYYYIISYLFNTIIDSGLKSIKEIFAAKTFKHYILLKKYVIPFLNLIDEIHSKSAEYNHFCYDYLLTGESEHKSIYVIENINQSDIHIIQILSETIEKYLKEKRLILTLTGCLFYTHEFKTGLFNTWLDNMYKLRKQYIAERDKYQISDEQFDFYNLRQKATKVAMNTAYGLFGQSTYRYSNNWLAKTITCQGRMTLKISQEVAETYLRNLKNENN